MIKNLDQLAKILELPNEKQIQLSNLFLEFLKTKDAQDLINTTEETLLSKFKTNIKPSISIIEDTVNYCKFIINNDITVSITLIGSTYTIYIDHEHKTDISNIKYHVEYSELTEEGLIKTLNCL